MDKYEFIKWLNTRLQNGRTIAEEIKYVDVYWIDEKGERHFHEEPSFPEAIKFAMSLNLDENDPILSSFPSQKCITLIKEHKE